MTIEASIFSTLGGFVGGRLFPDVAPFDTPRPYMTYQQIGGQVISPFGKEIPGKKNGVFQINIWAETRTQASALARQVSDALLQAATFDVTAESEPIWSHEPDLNLYGTLQDFSIWYDA